MMSLTLLTAAPALVAQTATDELTGVAGWIADVIARFGSPGVGFVVMLENLFPPIPSEAVLPAAGYLRPLGSQSGALRASRSRCAQPDLDPSRARQMPIIPFVALTAIGSFGWNLLLVGAGYWLGDRWGETATVSHWANIGVLIAAAMACAWWLRAVMGRAGSHG